MPNKKIMDREGFDAETGIGKRRKKEMMNYIKENLARGYPTGAIRKALVNYGFEGFFADRLIKRYKTRDVLLKSAFLITIVLLISSLLLFKLPRPIGLAPLPPEITGVSYEYSDEVNLLLNEDYGYIWNLNNKGNLSSVRLSGVVSKEGDFEVYLEHDYRAYLIFNSSGLSYSKQSENEPIVMGAEEKARRDIDNVFEFKVVNDLEWEEIDYSKVCTLWKINGNNICYGDEDCCSPLESLGKWNDSFYLSYGRYDSGLKNVVSAQLIYYDVNLSVPYSNIIYSDVKEIEAEFYEEMIGFEDVCIETCSLPGFDEDSYELIFIIRDGSLRIDSIGYSIEREVEVSENAPELVKEFDNITIYKDYDYWIELSEYFYDEGGEELSYSVSDVGDISVFIRDNKVQIVPDYGFTGKRYMYFTASDGYYDISSNVFFVDVVERPLKVGDVEVSEEVVKPKVVINRPVRWIKKVNASDRVINLSVDISSDALNVSVRDVKEDRIIDEKKLKIEDEGVVKDAAVYRAEKRLEQIDKMEDRLKKRKDELTGQGLVDTRELTDISIEEIELENERNRLTGYAVIAKEKGLLTRFFEWLFNVEITGYAVIEDADVNSVIIEDIIEEIEIEYYTEGPISEEKDIADGKRIVVSSDVHYEDILAYTYLDDVPESGIKLYRIVDGTRELVKDVIYYDEDNDGLIDYIEWVIPSLSNETYEVSITVLNVYSHPSLYGNWTVMLDTKGIANLTITATRDIDYDLGYTRWSELSEDESLYDLRFLDVRCGDSSVEYSWEGTDCWENECSVFIEDYSCDETGYEISKVLTPEKHVLRFNFGEQEVYAYNEVQNISECTTIFSPGTYYLNESIISNVPYCIDIVSNDVVLDCKGYTIGGGGMDSEYGIYIDRYSLVDTNITIRNCIITDWYSGGVSIINAKDVTLDNLEFRSNLHDGVYISYSQNNEIINSRFDNNYRGIEIDYSSGNMIYNNFFNNSDNIYFRGTGSNIWNIANISGTSIMGGNYLGGNYWAELDGTGFSQTCDDIDGDSICDESYTLRATDFDYLPLVVPDTIEPVVHLMYPANETVTKNATHVFSCNITDNRWVANLTLYVWDSTDGNVFTGTTELSGIYNSINWSIILPYDDTYSWNCLGYDISGNSAWSEEGGYIITLDRTAPVVHLKSPANKTLTNNATETFSCNITDSYVANLTLYVWNSSGSLNYTSTTVLSGTYGEAEWSYALPYDDTYSWNCLGYDILGNYNWSVEGNYSITLDTVEPVVHLVGPENNTNTTNSTQVFSCNITDNRWVANLTLYVWDSIDSNVFTETRELLGVYNSTNWSIILPYDDTFLWNCKGYDAAGNYNWGVEGNYTITLDTTTPVVHLVGPENNTNTTNSTQVFSCNITDNNYVANLTLYVWDSIDSNVFTETRELLGVYNSTNWSITLPYDDTYLWNCLGYDILGNYNWSAEGNYSITLDATAPVVHLMSPENGINTTVATQTFSCNITDNNYVDNLTLYVWNSTRYIIFNSSTDLSGKEDSASWTYTLPYEDNFLWNCMGHDTVGNSAWSVEGNYSIKYSHNITSCTTINYPGYYYMGKDIIDSSISRCITMAANDVILDCKGYIIDGDEIDARDGIYIKSRANITIENCTLTDWISSAINMFDSDNNTLENLVLSSNPQRGVYLYKSDNNNISDSFFTDNSIGLYIYSSADNIIYNNFFNNTYNFSLGGTIYDNTWNITITSGTNIVNGSDLGGNYWANSDGTGYSETCDDTNGDDFCDDPYILAAGNVDYLPLITPDNTPPDGYHIAAAGGGNGTITNQLNVKFEVNATDNRELSNITLYVWNSSYYPVYINTKDISGRFAEVSWDVIFTYDDVYLWSALIYDKAGNSIWTRSSPLPGNWTLIIDTIPPEVHLMSPENNTNTTIAAQTFTCNITDKYGVASLKLYVWNSTNGNVFTGTTELSGIYNSTNWSIILPYDDTYLWNCLGYDAAGNSDWSREGNYSITLDATAPVVHLVSPENNTNTTNATQVFSCNITDNKGVSNLTLYIWDSMDSNVFTETTELSGIANSTNWSIILPYDDNYLWNCLGYDIFGNYNWSKEGNYTITLDKTAPVVHLVSPENETITNNATQVFRCDITDNVIGIANLTVYIWNSGNILEYVNTTNLTGNFNYSEWRTSLPYEDTFLWNCKGYDRLGNGNWSVEGNYTITLDITPPVWKDNSTNATSSTKYNDSVRFGINWSDNFNLDSIIFSWNGSSGGELVNDSALDCGNASCVKNVTKIVNFTKGNNICWKWYANDTATNWNETDEWCFTVGNTPPRFNETLRNTTIYPLVTYIKQISCIDADNDLILYYDNVSQFNISNEGLISWMPTEADIGNISVNITCGDGEANVSQAYMLIVDFGLRINIISPENGTTLDYSYDVPFNFTTNREANCSYIADDGNYTHLKNVTSYNTALGFYSNGWHNISVNCTVSYFNKTETTTFRISDITTPDIIETSPNGTVYTSMPNISAKTDEPAICRYVPWTEGNLSTGYDDMPYNLSGNGLYHNRTLRLANGYYEFYARCIDNVGNAMTESANISFTVDVETIIITVPVPTGGGGGGVSRIGEKIVLLEIDAPSNQTIFSGDETEMIITLVNKGEVRLDGIFLGTETNAPDTAIILSEEYFNKLDINEKGQLRLNIISLADPKARIGRNRYYINLNVSVVAPVYDTSKRFFIDIEERNYQTRMESLQQIQFAEDLFKEHPECLELNEVIKQAQDSYDDYDYGGAISLIKSAIQACRDLIALEEEGIEKPAPKKKANMVLFVIEMIIILVLMSAMVYYYKRKKGKGAGRKIPERKIKTNLELSFEDMCKEMRKSIRSRNIVNAQKNYSELYALYKMVKSSSLPATLKDRYAGELSILYSKLSKIAGKR